MDQPMTEPVISKINMFLGGIAALLSYLLGDHWVLFFGFFLANVGDFITRWIAARVKGEESSKKCANGIAKKVGYWILIAVGFGMGAIFISLGEVIGIDLHVTSIFGWYVLGTLFINELRSILENLVDAGYNVPKILVKGLEIANKTLNVVSKIGDDKEKTDGGKT